MVTTQRRAARCILAALGAVLALTAPLRSAQAHPRLLSAEPAADSRLTTLPTRLSLTFSEQLTLALSRLTLSDSAGRAVALDTLRAGAGDAKSLTARIRGALAPGRYLVRWQAAGADGHPLRGTYRFEILPEAIAPAPREASLFSFGASEDTEFGVESSSFVAIRAVLFAGAIALMGILSLTQLILPRVARRLAAPGAAPVGAPVGALVGTTEGGASAVTTMVAEATRRAWTVASFVFVTIGVVTVARLVAQHATMFGAGEHMSHGSIAALLTGSSWGRGWWLSIGASAIGVWGVRAVRRSRAYGVLSVGVAALALATSLALSGHPAAASEPVLAIALDVAHVIGAGGWVGGLAAMMLLAVPSALATGGEQQHEMVGELVRAFSPTALAFAGLVCVTGVLVAWRNLGAVDALWRSVYGQTLMVKLALLSVAAAAGAYNWRRVLPQLGSAGATVNLRRSAGVELIAAVTVLVVTAILVATPMPSDAPAVVIR